MTYTRISVDIEGNYWNKFRIENELLEKYFKRFIALDLERLTIMPGNDKGLQGHKLSLYTEKHMGEEHICLELDGKLSGRFSLTKRKVEKADEMDVMDSTPVFIGG